MALTIRLQRFGANNAPFYRIIVTESKFRRDGRFVEIVGTYDPRNKNSFKQYQLKLDRIEHWMKHGAQPSDTVAALIRKERRRAPAPEAKAETPAPAAQPQEPAEATATVAEAATPVA